MRRFGALPPAEELVETLRDPPPASSTPTQICILWCRVHRPSEAYQGPWKNPAVSGWREEVGVLNGGSGPLLGALTSLIQELLSLFTRTAPILQAGKLRRRGWGYGRSRVCPFTRGREATQGW